MHGCQLLHIKSHFKLSLTPGSRLYSLLCRLKVCGYSQSEDLFNWTPLVWWLIKQHHFWSCCCACRDGYVTIHQILWFSYYYLRPLLSEYLVYFTFHLFSYSELGLGVNMTSYVIVTYVMVTWSYITQKDIKCSGTIISYSIFTTCWSYVISCSDHIYFNL